MRLFLPHHPLAAVVSGVVLCACTQPAPEASGTASVPPRRATMWPESSWHRATLADPHDPGPRDRGHGVVYHLLDGTDGPAGRSADTTAFHAANEPDAPVVGVLVTSRAPDGATDLALWTPVPLTTEVVEYGYEESGLPFDSVDARNGWHRVILGYTGSGQPSHGWAAIDDRLHRSAWTDLLMQMPLYFLDEGAASFHAAPGGPALTLPPRLAGSRYDMTATESRWPWLRVKVEYPGTMCDADAPADRQAAYYWVRALDDRGRPRVFYYTRGC